MSMSSLINSIHFKGACGSGRSPITVVVRVLVIFTGGEGHVIIAAVDVEEKKFLFTI